MDEILKTMMDSVSEADSTNKLTTETVRQWLLGYRSRYEEELRRFPQLATQPHFDLLMADYDRNKDGVFVVAVFQPETVSFLAGRGNSLKVREFAETDFPEDALNVIPELQKLFYTAQQPINIPKSELGDWLR